MKGSKINIIIADDNKDFSNILNDYISMQKDIVVTGIAANGVEALALIQEKKPDVVILDMNMPIMDGLEVLERLTTMNFDIKPHILVLSAVSKKTTTQKALALGADYYVLKPFSIETLVKKIRQIMNVDILGPANISLNHTNFFL
ncbi:response regulator [Clostridium estertheticum]|uniref:response regulator n=1 Tax=Clostridium estertheticum TaxID=238834 RepID=UPI001C6F40E4|nr:response regulator [Clostridium estertheticum]MBW9153527.1 response regulator [Clostridium estertheticum]WLC86347.1 response regulator [Clostridium estertheticum]